MKNKALLFLLAVAIVIPTVIAIISYRNSQTAPADERTAVRITIQDLSGKKFVLEKKEEGDAADRMIKMFLGFNENATKLVSLPDQLMGTASYLVTISTNVRDTVYQYYFSTNPDSAYLLTEDGIAYQLKKADAERFLTTEYAASVYNQAELPTLLLSDKYLIKPQSASWQYQNLTGDYVIADTSTAVTGDVLNYTADNGVRFTFSIEPDYCNVKITDAATAKVYFDDLYSNISKLSLASSTEVRIEVTAKWYKDSERNYYGEMSYLFDSTVSAPATFHLTSYAETEPGDIIAITGKNVKNPSDIVFTSSPSIGFVPKFIKDGDDVYALIPLGVELAAGDYTFTLTYSGVSQNLVLTLDAKTFGTSCKYVSSATYNSYYTSATIKEAEETLAPYLAYSSSKRYWNGKFAEGVDGTITCGFGRYYKLFSGDVDTGITLRQDGVDYYAAVGTDVCAVNDGEVIYAGYLDLWGNIVIIEHGYGLKSWYCYLDSYNVTIGQKISKGDKLGECGQSGFAHQSGVHIVLSVFDTPVCPYDVENDGIELK